MSELSFVIVGLGSAGQRHLGNLVALGYKNNIKLVRTGFGTLKNNALAQYAVEKDLCKALEDKPTAVIIANPTSLHMDTALEAADAGCHLFIEKPIAHSLEKMDELISIVKRKKLKIMVGYQFRFHPSLQKIKQWLNSGIIGKLSSVHAFYAEYLPAWHPWEDYRNSYSAKESLGGGALLTLCHPFDYLHWLIGEVDSVNAMSDHYTNLDIDVEDIALVSLKFKTNVIGSVFLDYIARPTKNDLTIIGENGTIKWSLADNKAILYVADVNKTETYMPANNFERNTMFLDEMRHFTDCISSDKMPVCSHTEGIHALKIVLAAKMASKERREINIASLI